MHPEVLPGGNEVQQMSMAPVIKKSKKLMLVGLPNTGKSHVFNNLSGEYTLVGNYAYTTVELRRGRCEIENVFYEVIDTPGLHSLYIHSPEEVLVRNAIFNEKPDVLIQCVDANRLNQSLNLTVDLLELKIPVVLCLNSIDETARRGVWIDSGKLSNLLGIAVVESVAVTGAGTRELKEAIAKAKPGRHAVIYDPLVEKGITDIIFKLPLEIEIRRKIAMLFLQEDPFVESFVGNRFGADYAREITQLTTTIRHHFSGNFGRIINQKRNVWIKEIVGTVVHKQKISLEGFSQSFAHLCRHPVWGIFILLAVVWVMYALVVDVASVISAWMNQFLWFPVKGQIAFRLSLYPWVREFLIGDYGVLSLGLVNALLTVLPILSVFFLFFNVLEDSGYIPNLCILTNKIFARFGLSGRAIMPISLGFGCKTMATMTTRCLQSKKEKFIAMYLIAFAIPCAAQMGLNLSILGHCGVKAFIMAYAALGAAQVTAGLLLNRIVKDDGKTDFIQELPRMRMPDPKLVLIKVYYRLYWFLKEAVPVFLYTAVILFVADKIGLLSIVKHSLSPIVLGFLGLPLQMVDVLIVCVARREAAAGMMLSMIQQGHLNYMQCIISVVLTTTFIPCLANIVAISKEGGLKMALAITSCIFVSSFLLSGSIHWLWVVFSKLG